MGSGGSGDGPSVSWSQQTRPAAAVTGRGDAVNRSRNRSSSGNQPGEALWLWAVGGPCGSWASRPSSPPSGQFPQPLLVSQLLQRAGGFLPLSFQKVMLGLGGRTLWKGCLGRMEAIFFFREIR
jgi:hypothetical protein